MLDPEPGLMIWTLITFVILVVILKRYAFGPLQRVIDNRRNEILKNIQAAEDNRREAGRLLAEYKQSIADAKHEAEDIIERARKVGETTRVEIVSDAKEHARKEVEDARAQIQRETRKAIREIKDQVADLAILAAEKVTARSISRDDHVRLLDEAVSEIDFEKLRAEE